MVRKKLLDYRGLEVRYLEEADEDIYDLLENIVQGSQGGIQYSIQNIRTLMKCYGKGLSFIALYKGDKMAGSIGLCRRLTVNCGVEYNSIFLRYLATRPAFQTGKVSAKRSKQISKIEESFKQKLFSLFSNLPDLEEGKANSPEPHLTYAYVESQNKRSMNFIQQAGYEYIRSFLTMAFSRFNPVKNPHVYKLPAEEEPSMAALLAHKYRNYCLYNDEFSFFSHNYYVMKKENDINAGVSAIPTLYNIKHVPGITGWLLTKFLPVMPYFRKLYRPGEFRFLVFNSIYCRDGDEKLLPALFESVCASEGHHIGMTWLDDNSELYLSLKKGRRMGIMNRFLKSKIGLVFVSFSNINAEDRKKFHLNPAYISGFDFA